MKEDHIDPLAALLKLEDITRVSRQHAGKSIRSVVVY